MSTVAGAVAAGAVGVLLGRNIFQSGNLADFVRRALRILDGAVSLDCVTALAGN